MPLTLDCLCPDNEAVPECVLTELWWEGAANYTSKKGIEAGASVTLYNGASPVESYDSSGGFSRSLSLDLVTDWANLFVKIAIDSSASQEPVPGGAAMYEASWWIRGVYVCGERTFNLQFYEHSGEDRYCWTVVDVTARSFAHSGGSGGYAILYDSGPLAACNGTYADSGEFDPLPENAINYVDSPSGSVCLCASGGVEPYLYRSVGALPTGMTLDAHTGCITGKTTYTGSNLVIAFQVSDANRDYANVTCDFMFRCGGIQKPMNRMH